MTVLEAFAIIGHERLYATACQLREVIMKRTDEWAGQSEKIAALKSAVSWLTAHTDLWLAVPEGKRTTVSGELLSELGFAKNDPNSLMCAICCSNGYVATLTTRLVRCNGCSTPSKTAKDRACCEFCNARGTVRSARYRRVYATCWSCRGRGSIPVMNPLIPVSTGLFANCQKRRTFDG
jgi:hypothetical protein